MQPRLDLAREFIRHLTGHPDTVMRFRMIDDTKPARFPAREVQGSVEQVWNDIRQAQEYGAGVFYVVNEVRPDLPLKSFAKDVDIRSIRAVFIDCDDGLPEPFEFTGTPTLVVNTSPGKGQAIWRVKGIKPEDFKHLQRRLIAHYQSDPQCINISRVFRLPGTLHQKKDPHLVTFTVNPETSNPFTDVAEVEEPKPSPLSGDPVPWEVLKDTLANVHPESRNEWRDVVAAVRATNSGTEEERLALLRDRVAPEWQGELEVIWDTMPPKAGGINYGTLYAMAKTAGYTPQLHAEKASEIWNDMVSMTRAPALPMPEVQGWVRFGETMDWKVPPVQEVIPDFCERGLTTFLAGPGGTHKSRLGLQWGMCVDVGLPVWGRKVEQATFNYLSYEDSREEVARRVQAIRKRLKIEGGAGVWRDLTMAPAPLAIISPDGMLPQPFYLELGEHLMKQAGHHFIVMDSTYDVFQFKGNTKIDEQSVHDAIIFLDRFAQATDSTILCLWHPSRSGLDRGDAGGWSVAWENKPRARLALQKVENAEIWNLSVKKRNNGPILAEPVALQWSEGALMPVGSDVTGKSDQDVFEAVLSLVGEMALSGQPINRTSKYEWYLDEVKRRTGQRITKEKMNYILVEALNRKLLTYHTNTKGGRNAKPAGYYPYDHESDGEGDNQSGEAA